jgi:hypothetical protein
MGDKCKFKREIYNLTIHLETECAAWTKTYTNVTFKEAIYQLKDMIKIIKGIAKNNLGKKC